MTEPRRVYDLFVAPNSYESNELIGKTIGEANLYLTDYGYKNSNGKVYYVCDSGQKDIRDNRIRVDTVYGKIINIIGFG